MTEPPRRLISLQVSPWSERARWVLDHHGLGYEPIEHVPFLGERRLRRLIGQGAVGQGAVRVTVPALLHGEQKLTDSWDIAVYADREGRGEPLIPVDRQAEIRRWNDLADRSMEAGRALVSAALLASPRALDETLPPGVPRFLRPWLRPITRHGTLWFARKYELVLDDPERHVVVVRAALQRLRAGLAQSSPHLLGAFSYADIVMAVLLQAVVPVADTYIPLGPAARRAWTRDDLASEFADLIAWRDDLYSRHRARVASRQ